MYSWKKNSKLKELRNLHADDRDDVRHDRISCPTQSPARGGIPRENRVPNPCTLCIIRVVCYTPYNVRTRDNYEKCNVFIH
jgi:hypothetical protein